MRTYRFCVKCEEIKKFELNKNINHSECIDCGSRFALTKHKEVDKKLLEKHYQKMRKTYEWLRDQRSLLCKLYKRDKNG